MNINKLKKKAALYSLKYIHPKSILGVGTGSTIFYLIEALNKIKNIISQKLNISLDK
ncbi:MAG: ribose 5-phosphate isomerase A, partial [Buchnera aphidicola]|nr:ribose 5-phosphate isomerase A [Buchnera aphidicola]